MKRAVFAVAALAAVAAAIVLAVVLLGSGGGSGGATALVPTRTAVAATPAVTPLPRTWPDGLDHPTGAAILISCFDSNADGHIDGTDAPELAGIDIPLVAREACVDAATRRDFYAGAHLAATACAAAHPPVLIVAIASAGSDIFDARGGESLGVLAMVNQIQARAVAEGIEAETVLATAAVVGADLPQTRMEQWLTHYVGRRLDAVPCLRAVLLGHSHGGVTVTSVTAALDATYSSRLFGVTIDRTLALYDRVATEYPAATRILNVFQVNEGWHGIPVDLPNVTNLDASSERAPLALSDGGGGLALVSHKTLDDSLAVQRRIGDAVAAWLASPP